MFTIHYDLPKYKNHFHGSTYCFDQSRLNFMFSEVLSLLKESINFFHILSKNTEVSFGACDDFTFLTLKSDDFLLTFKKYLNGTIETLDEIINNDSNDSNENWFKYYHSDFILNEVTQEKFDIIVTAFESIYVKNPKTPNRFSIFRDFFEDDESSFVAFPVECYYNISGLIFEIGVLVETDSKNVYWYVDFPKSETESLCLEFNSYYEAIFYLIKNGYVKEDSENESD